MSKYHPTMNMYRHHGEQVPTATPYAWPHDASMSPETTALIIIDMQNDCAFNSIVPPSPPYNGTKLTRGGEGKKSLFAKRLSQPSRLLPRSNPSTHPGNPHPPDTLPQALLPRNFYPRGPQARPLNPLLPGAPPLPK